MSKTIRLLARFAVLALASASVASIQAHELRQLSVEQKPFQALQATQSSLKVDSWINNPEGIYQPGDTLELAIRLNQDAHVRVFNIDAYGRTTLIYPNEMAPDTLLRAGQIHRLPAPRADYMFRVSPPYGTNLLQVVATTDSDDLIADIPYSQAGVFRELDWTGARLARHLQVIADDNYADWAFTEQVFDVVPDWQAESVMPFFSLPENDFDFRIQVQQDSYGVHEPLELTVYSEKACQLTLLSYDADGAWTLVSPNGWGTERIRVRPGVTHISADAIHYELSDGGKHSRHSRLLALCVPETQIVPQHYDINLVQNFMQQVVGGGRDQATVDMVIDDLVFQIARLDQAWASADF